MGRRNIYVSDRQVGLYDEAARLAGSLSAAVERGLELYVASRSTSVDGCGEVEVYTREVSGRTRHRFRGREVDEFLLPRRQVARFDGVTVYLTAQGCLAAWHWSDPDWSKVRSGGGLVDGSDDWQLRRGEALLVADDPEQLFAMPPLDTLDDEAKQSIRAAFVPTTLRVRDI